MELIQAHNIRRSFGTGDLRTEVLKGIDLTVHEGEYLGIMGKSGAGKSTLLYQLSLLDTPTEGAITVAGVDILTLKEVKRTNFRLRTLGYVFQDYALVPDLTAAENVLLPIVMRGASYAEALSTANKSIDEVGLRGKYNNLPSELSGGEQQRVAIARAIAGKPKILFADEPTANLDTASGQTVIDLITCLNREYKLTVVMVTHEREYAANCHRLVHMEDGLLVGEEQL